MTGSYILYESSNNLYKSIFVGERG